MAMGRSSKTFNVVALKPMAGEGGHAKGADGVHHDEFILIGLKKLPWSRRSRIYMGWGTKKVKSSRAHEFEPSLTPPQI